MIDRTPRHPAHPAARPHGGADQGVVRDDKGQEQPADKHRARLVSRSDQGGDPPGQQQDEAPARRPRQARP